MVNLKEFVQAIHDAIIHANKTLMDRNEKLLEKYFDERIENDSPTEPGRVKKVLVPKKINLEYPVLTNAGGEGKSDDIVMEQIQVPLITMVPFVLSQIEKATLTAEFELSLVDNELQLGFPGKKKEGLFHNGANSSGRTNGKLEIIISPQESSEGLKLIVEAYEAVLKRQITY